MATQKLIHQMTATQFDKAFPNEEACCAYLVSKRWPEGVKCPRCQSSKLTELKGNPWHWQCYACAVSSYRFSHITGTTFENTNKPLKDWFRVAHLMLTSKKSMSALQICRFMGFGSYKTAWYMCHRIRVALATGDIQKLGGIVEVDETFIGGKSWNKHDYGDGKGTGGIGSSKTPVAGAVSRKGNVVARVISNVKGATLEAFMKESVSDRVSWLVTDQWVGYRDLHKDFPHQTINHAKGDYVIGAVHTNTIEGSWSILKRGIVGTLHKVSRKYLPLYVAEFQFRYNNRKNLDIFGSAIGSC